MNNLTPVEQEAQISTAIGECMLAWSEVEIQICQIFSCLIEEDIAFTVWDSVISFEAKIKTVTSVIKLKMQNESHKVLWAKLARHINRKARKRNEIAHAGLAEITTGGRVKIVLVPHLSFLKIDSQAQMTAEMIKERVASFYELADALNWFLFSAFPAFPDEGPSRELRIARIPDLIVRLQTSDDQTPEDL